MRKPDPSVAANKRTDDLRLADRRLVDEKIAHIQEVQKIHIDYAHEFRDLIMKNAEIAQKNADTKAVNLAELLTQYKSETNAQITEIRVALSNNQGSNTGVKEAVGYILAGLGALISVIEYLLFKK
jgi:hypothetical protein